MLPRILLSVLLSLVAMQALAQQAPDFSNLPADVSSSQALVADVLKSSMDGFEGMRAGPISDEERNGNAQELRDIFKPIIENSTDPEAVNRQLQQQIRRLRTQDAFIVKSDFELFGWCRVTFDADNIMRGLLYETGVYSCRLDDPDQQQANALTEEIVQDIKTVIAEMDGWTVMDNKTRRENARNSITHHRQMVANAKKTANNDATVQIFKDRLELAEKEMNTDHFEMQQFGYYWTDENSPNQPGRTTKQPYTLSIMVNNTFYKPEEEQKNVKQHNVNMAITIVKPKPVD